MSLDTRLERTDASLVVTLAGFESGGASEYVHDEKEEVSKEEQPPFDPALLEEYVPGSEKSVENSMRLMLTNPVF